MSSVEAPLGEATVAAYDIARLAGVGRAAVSNWRRRYPDFPKPVGGTAASPLYSLTDVESWLQRHGRRFELSPGVRVWQRVRGISDDLRLGDLIGTIGMFLVFVRRKPRRWRTLAKHPDAELARTLPDAIAAAIPELPDPPAEPFDADLVALLREAADAAGTQDHQSVLDLLCDRYLEVHSRRRLVTPAPVADLMVTLVDPAGTGFGPAGVGVGPAGGVVFDPACGTGTLLLAAQQRGAKQMLGQELDPTLAQLAIVRLLLLDGAARVQVGDSLRQDAFAGALADAVVCNPPFADRAWGYDELASDPRWEYGLPPRGEPELAWLQHCLQHVHPGRLVAILMPTGAASRRAGRRIRSNLLRSGALRAVITLPESGPGAAAPPDLWVLRRPAPGDPPPSHLLVADATSDPAAAVGVWRAFLDHPDGDLPGPARAVQIIDLLDDEVDLSPARHLGRLPAGQGIEFRPTRAALAAALSRLTTAVPDLAEAKAEGFVGGAEVTLGELVRAGVLVIQQSPLRMNVDTGPTPVLTADDVRAHRPPSGRTAPEPGTSLLQPGDVVIPAGARAPAALVVTDGAGSGTAGDAAGGAGSGTAGGAALAGVALGPQLYLLRPDPDRLDPWFLAGFLRIAQGQAGYRSGSSTGRSDLHRLALPRLPMSEQRRSGEAFRRLIAFEDEFRQVSTLAETLIHEGFVGLAAGTLQLGEESE